MGVPHHKRGTQEFNLRKNFNKVYFDAGWCPYCISNLIHFGDFLTHLCECSTNFKEDVLDFYVSYYELYMYLFGFKEKLNDKSKFDALLEDVAIYFYCVLFKIRTNKDIPMVNDRIQYFTHKLPRALESINEQMKYVLTDHTIPIIPLLYLRLRVFWGNNLSWTLGLRAGVVNRRWRNDPLTNHIDPTQIEDGLFRNRHYSAIIPRENYNIEEEKSDDDSDISSNSTEETDLEVEIDDFYDDLDEYGEDEDVVPENLLDDDE